MKLRLSFVGRVFALAFLAVVSVSHRDADAAGPRLALVIGNSAYQHTPYLKNPRNDADDLAVSLERLGFTVIRGFDLEKPAMERVLQQFAAALHGAEAGVFFYAGHGLQVNGVNYLVPIDAQLASAAALDFEMVRLDAVQRIMEHEAATNILILDACRDNPLARNLASSMGTRSADVARGLAAVESGIGTLISFSTQPGAVSFDGTDRNSPFTAALLKQLASPGEDLSSLLINVRNDVMTSTRNQQVPWEHSALRAKFYFAALTPGQAPVDTPPGPAKQAIAAAKTPAETGPTQSPPPAARIAIASKAGSADLYAPVPIEADQIVKARLGEHKAHFWQIKAPAGRYRLVLDVRRADDANSNLQATVERLDPDGRALGQLIRINEVDVRRRQAVKIDTTGTMILRVTDASTIVDYWLGLFSLDAAVPFPYFVRTPKVEALELGRPVSAVLAPLSTGPDGSWYSIDVDAQDYRVSAQFTRSDGGKGNVIGQVDLFGPLGETGRGSNGICRVNQIDASASCTRKLVFDEKRSLLFRIRSENDAGYKVILKVEPLPGD
jgi:hypothetical protein